MVRTSPERNSLAQLAGPLQQPGALPEGVTLSLGLVASVEPRTLDDATAAATSAHFSNAVAATGMGAREVGLAEAHVAAMQDSYDQTVASERHFAGSHQNRLGMELSMGYTPSPMDLQRMFANQESAAENVGISRQAVEEAHTEFEDALAAQLAAQLDSQQHEALARLACETKAQIQQLGRRRRVGSAVAGLLMGLGVGLGLVNLDSAEKTSQENFVATSVVLGAATAAGGLVGSGFGTVTSRRAAHNRARRMVRRMGERQNASS